MARRRAISDLRWVYLNQVHGTSVVVVDDDTSGGVEADALVTTRSDAALVIATADCASIAFASDEGVIGAAHAGWKGLVGGIIGETATEMRKLGATQVSAALGPCIHSECYAYQNLEPFTERWGLSVAKTASDGQPSFDIPAAVALECERNDVRLTYSDDDCTACNGNYFSWRANKGDARQVLVVTR